MKTITFDRVGHNINERILIFIVKKDDKHHIKNIDDCTLINYFDFIKQLSKIPHLNDVLVNIVNQTYQKELYIKCEHQNFVKLKNDGGMGPVIEKDNIPQYTKLSLEKTINLIIEKQYNIILEN